MADNKKFQLNLKAILDTKNIEEQLKIISQKQKIRINADGSEKVIKDIKTMRDSMGNLIKLTTTQNTQVKEVTKNTALQADQQEKLRNRVALSVEQLKKMEITSKNIFKEYNRGGSEAISETQRLEAEIKDINEELQKQLNLQENLDKATVNSLINRQKVAKAELGTMKAKNVDVASGTLNTLISSAGKALAFGGITAGIGAMTAGIYSAIQSVFELDKAFTEVNKVMDLTSNQMKNLKEEAFDLGSQVGRSGVEVIDTVAEFGRAGYTLQESLDLSKTALIMTNVADGITDVGEASKSIIGIIKGFGLSVKDANKVLDLINYTSNTSATSFDGLTDVLMRSSASMKQAGNTLNETIGLATGALEILGTDQSERIGRGLTSLSMRIQGLSDVEGETAMASSKLNDELERLAGVSIFDENGVLRSTFDILVDLNEEWDGLAKNTKVYLSELLAGKTQAQVFTAIIENFDNVLKNSNTTLQAQGSALKENEAFLNSLEGKVNSLSSEFQKFSTNLVDSGLIKGILDFGIGLLKVENATGLVSTALITATPAIITFVKSMLGGVGVSKALNLALGAATGGLTWVLGGISAALMVLPKLFDAVNVTVEEQAKKIENLKGEYSSLKEEYDALMSKETKSDLDEKRLRILEAQLNVLEQQIDKNETLLTQKELLGKGMLGGGSVGESKEAIKNLEFRINLYENLVELMDKSSKKEGLLFETQSKVLEKYKEKIISDYGIILEETKKLSDGLHKLSGANRKLVEEQIKANESAIDLFESMGLLEQTISDVANETHNLVNIKSDFSSEIQNLANDFEYLNPILEDNKNGYLMSGKEIIELVNKYPELQNRIIETANGYTIEKGAIEDLINARKIETENAIRDSINKTKQILNDTRARILAHRDEQKALAKTSEMIRKTEFKNPFTGKSLESTNILVSGANKVKDAYADTIKESEDLLESLEKQLANVGRVTNETYYSTEKYNKSIKESSKSTREAKETFKDFTDEVKSLKKALDELNESSSRTNANLNQLLAGDWSDFKEKTMLPLEELKPLIEKQKVVIKALYDELKKLESIDLSKVAKAEEEAIKGQIEGLKEKIRLQKEIDKQYQENLEFIRKEMEKAYEEELKLKEKKYKEDLKLYEEEKKRREKQYKDDLKAYEDMVKKKTDAEYKRLKKLQEIRKKEKELENDAIKDKLDALKRLQDLVVQMIKQEENNKIESIEKQIEAIEKFGQAQKDALRKQKDDRDYQKGLKEREKNIANLEKRIAELQFDTSAKGTKERLELEQELIKAKEELEDYQYENSIKKQEEAIDEQTNKQKDALEKQIEQIKEYLSKEGLIRDDANKLIEQGGKELYDRLSQYNKEYVGMTEKELMDLVTLAKQALKEFGGDIQSVNTAFDNMAEAIKRVVKELEELREIEISKEDIESSIRDETSHQKPKPPEEPERPRPPAHMEENEEEKTGLDSRSRELLQRMINIGNMMKGQSKEMVDYYLGLQRDLADEISATTGLTPRFKNDQWWVNIGGKEISIRDALRQYHTGGIVGKNPNSKATGYGTPMLKSNEEFAKLLKGEVVASIPQMNNFMNKYLPDMIRHASNYTTNNSNKFDSFMQVIVQGNLDNSVIPQLNSMIESGIRKLNSSMENKGYKRSAKDLRI